MRTKQEIKQAVAILSHKADRLSLIMAEVLTSSMTEQQVFNKYVMEISEADRDENVFFAARDAARFLAGHIGVEELIPDFESIPVEELSGATMQQVAGEVEMIEVPLQTFREILGSIRQLEEKMCALCGMNGNVRPIAVECDLMELKDVLEYVGCGGTTLRRWVRRGVLPAPYRRGTCSYFSKSELDSNDTVQRYIRGKEGT